MATPFRVLNIAWMLVVLFVVAYPANAQKIPVVTWSGGLSRPAARAGEKIAVRITANVKPGYHIYSIKPVKDGPQATEIMVAAKGFTAFGKPVESKPEIVNDPNFGLQIGMHEGAPVFTQLLSVPKTAKPGSVPVSASVFFMACTDKACLPPKEVVVSVPAIKVQAGAARKEFLVAGESGDSAVSPPTASAGTLSPALVPANRPPDSGIGAFLATAFGAGLVALVTPCVFPLIPVTLAFFTKQVTTENGEAKQGGVVKLAALYCLGIVLAFTAIGAVLAATVGAAGANQLASNPYVNLGFGILFIVFALSLLEVIEIKPPAFLQKLTNGNGPGAAKNATNWGVLGMGLTFVIAAFTCTAPFIGTVLVAAASAQTGSQWVRPILGMTTFALALALPFFVLALFPSLLARLPKSGAWLSTVKGAMGWIELAAAVKFISGADQVWGLQILNEATILGLWAIVFLAGGFWLLGLLRIGWSAPDAPATPLRGSFAAVFLAIGVYCVYGLTGRPLDSFTVAYLPPTDYGIGAKQGEGELEYLDSLEAGLAQAKAENKPIFIDFTGHNCTNCRWMERNIFPKPLVNEELSKFVRVRLITDDRKLGPALQAYQEKTFGTVELPLYAVLDANGKPVTKPVGKTDTAEAFARFLRGGRETVFASSGTASVARK
ncbi:MAG: thioredoxin family protein [Fibrella sp.]|nr:thioredoxin family protein [Armatimonadota bacterium]